MSDPALLLGILANLALVMVLGGLVGGAIELLWMRIIAGRR